MNAGFGKKPVQASAYFCSSLHNGKKQHYIFFAKQKAFCLCVKHLCVLLNVKLKEKINFFLALSLYSRWVGLKKEQQTLSLVQAINLDA